ncbi:MAG: HDOD domain-containing protein [Planctomycetota bacterium]
MKHKSPIQTVVDHSRARREIQSSTAQIPSLPEVVTEVLRLLDNKGTEISRFEDVLCKDPALVAKMLRVVNSPFYGLVRTVTTIKDAVMVLGFRSLRSLVLAASTARHLTQDFACYGHCERGLWVHALAVASAARTLARFLREGPDAREELFVAGLLHDIGKLAMLPYMRELDVSETARDGDVCGFERRVLGITHEEAGGIVARRWGLSALVTAAVEGHHCGQVDAALARPLAIVRLADAVARQRGHGYREDFRVPPLDVAGLRAELGLSDVDWDEALFDMDEAMESAITTLGSIGGRG